MQRLTLLATLCCVLLLAGCGGSSDRPELFEVTGTVTYKGSPLPNATVLFTPESGPIAQGQTNEQGVFSLATSGRPGAVTGTHRVAVVSSAPAADTSLSSEEMQAEYEKTGRMPSVEQVSLLADKYASPETSGLSAPVTAEGPNEFTFDLQGQ